MNNRLPILKYTNIDASKIDLSTIDHTREKIYITYQYIGQKIPLLIETEYMPILSIMNNSVLLLVNFSMEEFLNNIDMMLISTFKENVSLWSFLNHNEKIKYESILDETVDNENNNLNILKLDMENSMNFNNKKELMSQEDIEQIRKEDSVLAKAIIEVSHIWFKNNTFGLHLKVHQLKFKNLNKDPVSDSPNSNDSVSSEIILTYSESS